jgi:hypothetical protein
VWLLAGAAWVVFEIYVARREKRRHSDEPSNIYNTRKTYGGEWKRG